MFIVLPKGNDIVDVILGEPGPTSDISQFRASQDKFSSQQQFRGDIGYQGETQIATPNKKLKQKELTAQQKKENTESAQRRVYVEHIIRLIKISRIAQQRFRLRANKYKGVMQVVCGLVRLRVKALILPSLTREALTPKEIKESNFQESFC